MSTAIEDIEALAAELEAAAIEHRVQAERAEGRAADLRDAAARLTAPAEGGTVHPFHTSIATRPEGARATEAAA